MGYRFEKKMLYGNSHSSVKESEQVASGYVANFNSTVGYSVSVAGHSSGQPEVMQQTTYYPFGYTLEQSNNYSLWSEMNKKLYNGKELQDDELGGVTLDWYDYGARFYNPQIGRWNSVDPMAEQRSWLSSYNFCSNNPIMRIDPTGALNGDYYDKNGNHLGSDGIDDDKAYYADGKNADGTFRNARELNISNSELNQFANTIAVESGAEKSGSWQESFGIGLAIRNMSSKFGGSIYKTISGGGVFGFRDGGNSTEYKNNAEFSMQAALYSVMGGTDFTNGATKWDGIDFLAWGLKSPDGTPHNKFEEYRNIYIENSIYDNYKTSIINTVGSSTRYYGKSLVHDKKLI